MERQLLTRRLFLASLLLVGLLSACISCQSSAPKLPKLKQGDKILAFGDSLTFGTGASAEDSYPAQLSKIIGKTVIRSGVPGEVTAQGLERLPKELERHRPTLLLLCHGGNDFLRRHNTKSTVANLRQMIQLAQDKGVSVLLIGVPQLGNFLSIEASPIYDELAEEMRIPIEEETLSDLISQTRYKSDGIHLNSRGYKKLAEAIADLLKKSGAV